jgi:hypothetical protein
MTRLTLSGVPPAAALVAPLAVVALLLVAFGPALEGRGPLGTGGRLTVAEAVLLRDYGFLERHLAAGGSLATRSTVRAGLLTGSELELTPLEAAIAIGYEELFDYVWSRSPETDPARLDALLCLARRSERPLLAARLEPLAGDADCAAARYPW